MAKKSDITLTELRALIKDFYPNLSMKEFNALTKGGMEAKKADEAVRKIGKAKGGVTMKKKTKYMSKGGTVKRMGGGKAKNTKYRSKGGVVKRRSGGRAGKR